MFVEISPSSLSAEALRGVVEEFVTREGTDYGHQDYSLEQKIERVFRQLKSGDIAIVFDPESESCNLVPRETIDKQQGSEE